MSQWQGDPNDEIMVVVFKGKHISEPFHRQDFFFIDYAYHLDYNALSAKFDNLITVREGDCYIGQPCPWMPICSDSSLTPKQISFLMSSSICPLKRPPLYVAYWK